MSTRESRAGKGDEIGVDTLCEFRVDDLGIWVPSTYAKSSDVERLDPIMEGTRPPVGTMHAYSRSAWMRCRYSCQAKWLDQLLRVFILHSPGRPIPSSLNGLSKYQWSSTFKLRSHKSVESFLLIYT